MNAYLHNSDLFCEFCSEPGDEAYPDGGGEADCPQHCGQCHQPLDNSLTTDGVAYVIEAVIGELEAGPAAQNAIHACYKGTYFEGSRHCEITRGWAEQIQDHDLAPADQDVVDHFLEVTAEPQPV